MTTNNDHRRIASVGEGSEQWDRNWQTFVSSLAGVTGELTVPTGRPEPTLEERIDRAIDSRCPCGAEPSEELFPYCSHDCTPTHRGENTNSRPAGTQGSALMRWRPDLVSAIDDSALEPLTPPAVAGSVARQAFLRGDGRTVHLRVDDGHRFVGADIDRAVWDNDPEQVQRRWRALRRELGDVYLTVEDLSEGLRPCVIHRSGDRDEQDADQDQDVDPVMMMFEQLGPAAFLAVIEPPDGS